MSDAGFGNRGNRDASVVNIKGMGQIDGTRRSGPVGAGRAGDPFLIGEAIFGLTVVNETTEPTYWVVIGAIGLALLLVMLIRRLRGAGPIILAITGTAAIAAAFVPIYTFVGERGLG